MPRRLGRAVAERATDRAPATTEVVPPADPLDPLTSIIADAVARRMAGGTLTPWELPTVFACRRLIADTVSQLPLVAMRGRRPRPDQPSVYRRPDPSEPAGRSLERIMWNLTGDGYAWLVPTARDAAGWPAAVRVLDAHQAWVTSWDIYGRMAEVVDVAGIHHRPGDSIVWIPASVPSAGEVGRSPIGACWRAVDYLCSLYDMMGSYWESGFPSVAIQVPQRLSTKQAGDLKARVVEGWARRHEPAVIDMGGTLAAVGSNAVEAQLVESVMVANTEIARAFGALPSMVNVSSSDSLTYSTTEGQFRNWLATGLGGYLRRVEDAFSDIAPYGTTARLDTSELARADVALRVASYAQALGNQPWLTVDEVRDREGYDPMGAPSTDAPPTPLPVGGPTP